MLTLSCVAATADGTLMCLPHFVAGPHFAAVNSNNEIIVTDFHNHSVKVLLALPLLLTLSCFYRETALVEDNVQTLRTDWSKPMRVSAA